MYSFEKKSAFFTSITLLLNNPKANNVRSFLLENCTVMGMTGSPRGPRVTRGDGGKLHGLAAGMGAKNTGSPRGWAQ